MASKSTRTPLMAGNWKMNLNHQEAVVLVQKLAWTLSDKRHDFGKVEFPEVPIRAGATTTVHVKWGSGPEDRLADWQVVDAFLAAAP